MGETNHSSVWAALVPGIGEVSFNGVLQKRTIWSFSRLPFSVATEFGGLELPGAGSFGYLFVPGSESREIR